MTYEYHNDRTGEAALERSDPFSRKRPCPEASMQALCKLSPICRSPDR
jgi:hypothetical protein